MLSNSKIFDLRKQIRSCTEDFIKGATKEKFGSVEVLISAMNDEVIRVLDLEIAFLKSIKNPSWAKRLTTVKILKDHGEDIDEYIDLIFDEDVLPDDRREKIRSIVALSLLKEFQRGSLTGLVFAGFGKNEIFPSLISVEVYGTVAGKLKFERRARFDVDRSLQPDAAAFPFAQKEMVDRFMYGLDEEFLDLCNTYFDGALASLKGHLRNEFQGLDDAAKAALDPAVDAILNEFNSEIVPKHLDQLRSQFSDMIRSMPKQELASLAESLVHITSLKRKFSAGAESVGGPIDVAMITRAEGFVWVKRKHYFDASLNPRYFYRRYGGNNQGTELAVPGEAPKEEG